MTLKLKTKLNLPLPIQTDAHLALPTNGRRGLCVSFYDPDQLDHEALNYAKELKQARTDEEIYAADIGCSSYFPQAIRFAQIGLTVDAFDFEDPIDEYKAINQELGHKINYIQTDLKQPLKPSHHSYSIVYSNRFISHITFHEAKNLLLHFIKHANKGCRFYISFGALESYEAAYYPDRLKTIEERYSKISGDLPLKHQWTEPVCLYTKSDIYDKLLKNLPIQILDELKGSVSIKIIFSKL